mgnify:CR=1 FL=1
MIDYYQTQYLNHWSCSEEEILYRRRVYNHIGKNLDVFWMPKTEFTLRHIFDNWDGPYVNLRTIIQNTNYNAIPGWMITGILKYQPFYSSLDGDDSNHWIKQAPGV